MLRQIKDLQDLSIAAIDGDIGDVKDLFFDDEDWAIRYLVVDAGSWLSSRKVLISPISAGKPNWHDKILPVSLTQEQVKNSPDIDTEIPVTRQHETDYMDYYSYPYYWSGLGPWGMGAYPGMLLPGYGGIQSDTTIRNEADAVPAKTDARQRDEDPHLRSCKTVVGYHIEASDGEIGHVNGMLIDEESWTIRYLVVNTSNWWLGHDVLVAPQWIKSMSWTDKTVTVDLTREALKQAPEYDAAKPLSREMELVVYEHYGLDVYWPEEARREEKVASDQIDA